MFRLAFIVRQFFRENEINFSKKKNGHVQSPFGSVFRVGVKILRHQNPAFKVIQY